MSSKMGKNKNCLLVSASVLAVLTIFFGLLGAILVVATAPRSNQGDSNYRPAAMPCGIVAALLALTTQIVAGAAIGCCGCCCCLGTCPAPKSKGSRVLAVLLFILSWVLAVATVITFLLAASMVGSGGFFHIYMDDANAPGVLMFVVPTVLFKIVVGLDIVSYVFV
ncbi:hypothetical protein ZWY2020_051773 [Hordeum vulgare]|nr:hypothetical protein ZWY2020_051773 [Hordeum vulgare]